MPRADENFLQIRQKRRNLLQPQAYTYTDNGQRGDKGYYIAQETARRRRRHLLAEAPSSPAAVAAAPLKTAALAPAAAAVTVIASGPMVVTNESLPTKVASGTTTVRRGPCSWVPDLLPDHA